MSAAGVDPHSLTRHNRYDELKQLVSGGTIDPMSRDEFGNALLHVAAQNGLKRMAKLFLRHGAEISCRNRKGNTPLHFCYLYGYGNALGAYLESKGADRTAVNSYGIRPPQMAEYDAGQLAELEADAEDYQPDKEDAYQQMFETNVMATLMRTQGGAIPADVSPSPAPTPEPKPKPRPKPPKPQAPKPQPPRPLPKDGSGGRRPLEIKKSFVMRPLPAAPVDLGALSQERQEQLRQRQEQVDKEEAWAKAKRDAEALKRKTAKQREDARERLQQERRRIIDEHSSSNNMSSSSRSSSSSTTTKASVRAALLGKKKPRGAAAAGTSGGSSSGSGAGAFAGGLVLSRSAPGAIADADTDGRDAFRAAAEQAERAHEAQLRRDREKEEARRARAAFLEDQAARRAAAEKAAAEKAARAERDAAFETRRRKSEEARRLRLAAVALPLGGPCSPLPHGQGHGQAQEALSLRGGHAAEAVAAMVAAAGANDLGGVRAGLPYAAGADLLAALEAACARGRLGAAKLLLQQLPLCGGTGGGGEGRVVAGVGGGGGDQGGEEREAQRRRGQRQQQQAVDKMLLLVAAADTQSLPLAKLLLPWATGGAAAQALVAVAGSGLGAGEARQQARLGTCAPTQLLLLLLPHCTRNAHAHAGDTTAGTSARAEAQAPRSSPVERALEVACLRGVAAVVEVLAEAAAAAAASPSAFPAPAGAAGGAGAAAAAASSSYAAAVARCVGVCAAHDRVDAMRALLRATARAAANPTVPPTAPTAHGGAVAAAPPAAVGGDSSSSSGGTSNKNKPNKLVPEAVLRHALAAATAKGHTAFAALVEEELGRRGGAPCDDDPGQIGGAPRTMRPKLSALDLKAAAEYEKQ